jgi:DNA-binding SARP family transcriptional activator
MGQPVWPRGGDAKPWELLLFLACQPAEGASRDAVVEAIWPDSEAAEDLPHRIRQLRYRLRHHLQEVPDAPEADGIYLAKRGVRLDPDIVYSDAREFLSLVRTARLSSSSADMIEPFEKARALYVGDLLDGPDTRRYAWVDERDDSGVTLREHFRRMFQNASLRLAEAYAECDHVEASMELYRELAELDPADERLWIALLRLHHRRGDIRGLMGERLRLDQSMRELAEDLDMADGQHADEPSRELLEEYQRLLASLRALEPAAV